MYSRTPWAPGRQLPKPTPSLNKNAMLQEHGSLAVAYPLSHPYTAAVVLAAASPVSAYVKRPGVSGPSTAAIESTIDSRVNRLLGDSI